LQIAHGVLHLLFEFLQVGDLAFFVPGKLIGLISGDARTVRTKRLPHLTFEALLLPCQFFGLPRHIFHLIAALGRP
jgi:hypothetical protein